MTKKKLTVNSSMAEFREAIKKLRLTLPEAQEIAYLIFDKRVALNSALKKSYCPHCFKSGLNAKILKRTEDRIKFLDKMNKKFYPYMKYDW